MNDNETYVRKIHSIRGLFVMKNLTLVFALFICCCNTFAQANSDDSLRSIWLDESQADSVRFNALQKFYLTYSYSKPDSSLALTNYHLKLAKQKNDSAQMAKAFNEKALAHYVLNRVDSSVAYLTRVLEIKVAQHDSAGIAQIQANLGSMYREQNNYQEAVRSYAMSMSYLSEKKAYEHFRADVLNNIGLIYEDIGMHQLALEYLNEALALYIHQNLEEQIGNIWLNIGAVEYELKNTEKALTNLRKATKILAGNNNLWSLAIGFHQLAVIFSETGQIDSANVFLEKSLAINQALGNDHNKLINQTLKAELLLSVDISKAVLLGEEVLKLSQTFADKSLIADVSEVLYKAYKKQNRLDLSLKMLEQHKLYHDSLLIEENNIAIVREAIQSEYELKMLKSQLANEKQQAKLELSQVKRIYSIILGSIVLILLILFYSRFRINEHRKQKMHLLDEIERLKSAGESVNPLSDGGFQLDRNKIDQKIDRKLNETDWRVLNILLIDPVISNKEIAEQAFLSTDGIGSSLRRMYLSFDIKESKYMKISLLLEAIKISNSKL